MGNKLSTIRQSILRFIIKFMEEHDGRAPTNREIGDSMKSKSTGYIAHHLGILEEKGYISHERNKSRSIKVLKDWQDLPVSVGVNPRSFLPVKGPIAAGQQLTIPDEPDEMLELGMQNFSEDAFGLKVQGLSMVSYGIFDGDYLIVEPSKEFEEGDMVVATHRTDNAATVKHFYGKDGKAGKIKLQPDNTTISPIYVEADEWDNEWEVQGIVKAVFRVLDRVHVKGPRSPKIQAGHSAFEQH